MKKIRKFLIMGLTAAVLLNVGCNSHDSSDSDNVLSGISPEDIATAIMDEVEIPSAVQKSAEELLYYIDLDPAVISEVSYYICGSGGFPDEILIVRFESPQAAENAKPIVQTRLNERSNDFRDYSPGEMYKLDGAVLLTDSNWLFYFVTEDNQKAKEVLDGFY